MDRNRRPQAKAIAIEATQTKTRSRWPKFETAPDKFPFQRFLLWGVIAFCMPCKLSQAPFTDATMIALLIAAFGAVALWTLIVSMGNHTMNSRILFAIELIMFISLGLAGSGPLPEDYYITPLGCGLCTLQATFVITLYCWYTFKTSPHNKGGSHSA